MDDDFNTGGAIGVLHELLGVLKRFAADRQLESGQADPAAVADFRRGVIVLRELTQILGLFREPVRSTASGNEQLGGGAGGNEQLVSGLIQLLIDLRADARKSKNFPLGDQIRQRLKGLGVFLEDRAGSTTWRLGEPEKEEPKKG
jgi:cysteinyl-tRNA synthetase